MVGKNACVPLKFTFSFACPNDFCRLQSFFPLPAPKDLPPAWKMRIKLIFSLFEVLTRPKAAGKAVKPANRT